MSTNNTDEHCGETSAEAQHENKKVRPQKRKSMLNILIYICGALVVVGGLWLGYLGVSGSLQNQKRLALCVLFGTLLFVLVGAFFYLYQSLEVASGIGITGAKLREPLVIGNKPRTLVYFLNNSSERAHVVIEDQSVLYAPNTFKGPLKYQPMHNEPAEFELNTGIPYTLDTVWDIVITEAMAKELEADNATIYFYFRTVSSGQRVPYCFRYNRATLPDLPLCPASMKVEQ